MALFDEPKNRPGTAQVLTEVNKNPNGDKTSQVWLNVPDNNKDNHFQQTIVNTLTLPSGLFSIVADSVLWLSISALVYKFISFVNHLIAIGLLNAQPATLVLALVGFPLLAVVLLVYSRIPNARGLVVYRISLFVFGLLLGLL